jgi:hypothetical protein
MVNFTFHILLSKTLEPIIPDIKKEWALIPNAFSNCIAGMELKLRVETEFITEETISKITSIPQFFTTYYPAEKYINTFFLLFDFKKLTTPHTQIEHSIDGNRFFAVPIWDLTEDMISNSNTVNVAMMREYYTFITSFNKNFSVFSSEHDGDCLRIYMEPVLPEDLRVLERMKRLAEARYKNVPLLLCKNCANTLCESFINFLSQTSDAAEQLANIKEREVVVQESKKLIEEPKSDKPQDEFVPSYVSYSNQVQKQTVESVSKFHITPEQKARINRIMLDLGIKEPVSNEFYLEIRERFLKGKLSEHAYKQQAKRFSR